MRKIPDSPDIDSSGETGKTPSGPTLHDRPGQEMAIAACPPVPPQSSNSPPLQIGHNREITPRHQLFIGSPSLLSRAEIDFFSGSGALQPHNQVSNGSNSEITQRYQVFINISS